MALFSIVIVLLCVSSHTIALDMCNPVTIDAISQQIPTSKPAINSLAGGDYWFVLMTEDDVNIYGIKSLRLTCGDLITANSLVANLTTTYKQGWDTKSVHVEEIDTTYMLDTQYDGVFEAHPFICSENLIVNYRCLADGYINGGAPMLDVLVRMKYTLEDVQDQLEGCISKMAEIAPEGVFLQLERPS